MALRCQRWDIEATVGKRVGIVDGQGGRAPGVADADHVEPLVLVDTAEIGLLRLSVGHEIAYVIEDGTAKPTHHRDGADRRQQRKDGVLHQYDSHLSCWLAPLFGFVVCALKAPHGHQVSISPLCLVANETDICRCRSVVCQWLPLLQQGHGERFSLQAVDDKGVGKVVVGVTVAHDEDVALRRSEQQGNDTPHGDGLDRGKGLPAVKHLNAIAQIFCRGGRYEAFGMASRHRQFTIGTEHCMSLAGRVQIGKTLRRDVYPWTGTTPPVGRAGTPTEVARSRSMSLFSMVVFFL